MINCTTGKDELGKPSRISKQCLFRRFYNLLDKLDTIDDADKNQCRHYLDAKSSVQNYSVSRWLNAVDLIMKTFRIHGSVVQHCFCFSASSLYNSLPSIS